jgi:hypothetical protein
VEAYDQATGTFKPLEEAEDAHATTWLQLARDGAHK